MIMHPSVRLSLGLGGLFLALLCCSCSGEGVAVQVQIVGAVATEIVARPRARCFVHWATKMLVLQQ
jgi:hypothetical protein